MSTVRFTTSRQRGFLMLEAVLAVAVFTTVLGVALSLTSTTVDMTQETNVQTRAHAEHRRNLLTLANILRTASIYSLQGFDEDGLATQPEFQRLLGVDIHERLYTDPERLEWQSADAPVNGISGPGAIWLVGSDNDTLVAARVPEGGFVVRQEGNVLAVRLTTYYSTDENHTHQLTSEIAVELRN